MLQDDKWMDQTPEIIARGYAENGDIYECLLCGEKTERGIVYRDEECLVDAERRMRNHVRQAHGSVFDWILARDRKQTGLTEQQGRLFRLFMDGHSDVEIMRALGLGNASTVRNHRAQMKERERHARIWLAMMAMLRDGASRAKAHVVPHDGAVAVDDRWEITLEEEAALLKKYFLDGPDGRIVNFSMKEKGKIVVLRQLCKRFKPGRAYSEKEVNEILKGAHADFATLRRYLIEYGFMVRNPDGSRYWLKPAEAGSEQEGEVHIEKERALDERRKKELLAQFRELRREGGAYCIRCLKNGRVFVAATSNFRTMNGRRFDLGNGTHPNAALQADWNAYGEEAFVFEILERLEERDESPTARKWALDEMERKWIEKLQPFGDAGYHRGGPV